MKPGAEPPSQPSHDHERLAQAIDYFENGAHGLTPQEKTHFRTLLQEFADVISVGDLGRANMVRHTINTGNADPIHQQPRHLPFHQKEQKEWMKCYKRCLITKFLSLLLARGLRQLFWLRRRMARFGSVWTSIESTRSPRRTFIPYLGLTIPWIHSPRPTGFLP